MAAEKPTGRKQAAKNISIYAVGTIVRQLAAFIMLPIYTSYLTPADYGIVSLLVLMLSLFELVLGARFIQAIPKFYYEKEREKDRRAVITTALVLTAAVSVISVSIVGYFSGPIAQLAFDSVEYTPHVQLYSIVLLTSALEGYGLTYFRIQEKPILFIVNSIAKLVVQLGLSIYFVVHLELGVLGVVYSAVISSTAFGLFAVVYILYCNGCSFNRALVKQFINFSWPLWLAGLAGLYVGSSSQAYIKIFSSLSDVGLFALASKFASVLGVLIWSPFSQWWQTERFKLYNQTDQGVGTFPRVFNIITLILYFVAMGLALYSEPVIKIMAESSFHAASSAIVFLVFANLISNLTNFFRFSFLVKEKTIWIAYIDYASAVSLTIFLFILIPLYGFIGAALAVMFNDLLKMFFIVKYSKIVFDNRISFNLLIKLSFLYLIGVSIDSWLISDDLSLVVESTAKTLLLFLYSFILVWLGLRDQITKKILIESYTYFRDLIFGKYFR